MEFKFGELPDDHVFLTRVRSLVDWTFKLIAWLALCATLQVAAQTTGSPYICGLSILAYLMIFFFCQSFLDWLWHLKRYTKKEKPTTAPKPPGRLKRWSKFAIAGIVWLLLIQLQQRAVSEAIGALVSFQKDTSRTLKGSN
jgi:hypothetical protein